MSKKSTKIVVLAVAGVLVLGQIIGVYWFVSKRTKKDTTSQTAQPSAEVTPTYGIQVYAIDEINSKYADPTERLIQYDNAAGTMAQQGKNEEAYTYYEAISKLEGVDQSMKQQTMYSAYSLAKRTNDEKRKAQFTEILGAEVLASLEGTTLNVQE